MKTVSILLVFTFLSTNFSFAQSPVKWIFSLKKLDTHRAELTYNATIEKGWKIYAQENEMGGPVPLIFDIEANFNIKTISLPTPTNPPDKTYSKIFDMPLSYYKEEAVFKQVLEIEKDASSAQISGYLTYMTCDSERCLPPKDVEYNFCFTNHQPKTFNGKPIKSIRVGHCSSLPNQD